jgi:hypothetical protein
MFDSHPELAIPGESYFITELAEANRHAFERDRAIAALLGHHRFRQWGLDEGRAREAIVASDPVDYVEVMRAAYRAFADHQCKPRYGDKTPIYVESIEFLAELFPEARFIHIVRDGRDAALSLVEMPGWGPDTIRAAAVYWKKKVLMGRTAGRALEPGRYREVRYEDLVADPEGTLRQLCDFIELRYDSAMLRYPERAAAIVAPDYLPDTHTHIARPPTEGIRDWRREMAAADVDAFQALAGEVLVASGYELAPRSAARTVLAKGRGLARRVRRLVRIAG